MMVPSWIDPKLSMDGIIGVVTLLGAGWAALRSVLRRFSGIETQSKANAATLQEHGIKLDQVGMVLIRMEKSDGRMNLLEQIQSLQGQRLDRLTDALLPSPARPSQPSQAK